MTTPVMRVAIALGSNLGDRAALLASGLSAIRALSGVTLLAATPVEETIAFGPPQPDYLNQMILVASVHPLAELLPLLQGIEQRFGRDRHAPKGPRTLDLDIVWSDAAPVTTARLLVPHPGLLDRAFWQQELRALLGDDADTACHAAAIHAGRDTAQIDADSATGAPPGARSTTFPASVL